MRTVVSDVKGFARDRSAVSDQMGKMGKRMQEILAMPPERRPINQYAAYAEVAR